MIAISKKRKKITEASAQVCLLQATALVNWLTQTVCFYHNTACVSIHIGVASEREAKFSASLLLVVV